MDAERDILKPHLLYSIVKMKNNLKQKIAYTDLIRGSVVVYFFFIFFL